MWQRRTSEWDRSIGSDAPDRRLRVPIEDRSAAWFADFARFRSRGFEAAVCSGPEHADEECANLAGGRCPLADDADVVLFALDLEEPASQHVLESLREARPDLPFVIAASGESPSLRERWPTVDVEASVTEKVAALRRALGTPG